MRIAKLLAVILVWSPAALAQLTQVSGTVKDPTGLPYSNGTIVATLVISGTPRFTFNSLPYTPPSQPVGLDANGSFVMSLADVNQLTPSGGTWSFHVCSAQGTVQPGSPITQGPVCFDAPGFIITGTSVNISTQLSSASARLTTGGAGGSVTVTPGTTGQFAIYSNPTTVSGTPALTTNGTAITATVPVNTPQIICPLSTTTPCLTSNAAANQTGIGFLSSTNPFPSLITAGGTNIGQILALRVNGTNVQTFAATPAANFNATTPAAPANGINVTWQTAVSNPATISAAVVGNGTSSNFLNGTGVFSPALPPVNTLGALPACTASTEGLRAVATNCSGSCFSGQACTVSGTQHCEVYCNGTSYAETGVAVPQQSGVVSGTGGTATFAFNVTFISTPACTVTPFAPAALTSYVISLATNNTQLVITYAPTTASPNFAFICAGNPN